MNFKSILFVGLSVATLGLSLPAHADTATDIKNSQDAVITGDGNYTRQNNNTKVNNRQTGRRSGGDTGTAVSNDQKVDVLGNDNTTRQNNTTKVDNIRRRR